MYEQTIAMKLGHWDPFRKVQFLLEIFLLIYCRPQKYLYSSYTTSYNYHSGVCKQSAFNNTNVPLKLGNFAPFYKFSILLSFERPWLSHGCKWDCEKVILSQKPRERMDSILAVAKWSLQEGGYETFILSYYTASSHELPLIWLVYIFNGTRIALISPTETDLVRTKP